MTDVVCAESMASMKMEFDSVFEQTGEEGTADDSIRAPTAGCIGTAG